jgi:hypothetical protein
MNELKFKKMDTGTMVVGLFMLALCVLPFALIHFNRKKIRGQMLFSISKMVAHEEGKLTDFEFTTSAIIGLDGNQNKVFLYRKHKDRETRELIKLSDFQRCELEKIFSLGQKASQDASEIERVNLKFIPKTKGIEAFLMEFYNASESFNLKDELEFAKNWEIKINKQLQFRA